MNSDLEFNLSISPKYFARILVQTEYLNRI